RKRIHIMLRGTGELQVSTILNCVQDLTRLTVSSSIVAPMDIQRSEFEVPSRIHNE
ncbi:hypothetical protein CRM22_001335, partial [Opisthorchis felineus]